MRRGRRIRVERVDRRERAERADPRVEVAAADADAVRDAAAHARDERGDFLQAGAGGRHDADVAARHDVGEGERRAGDERRAAVGSHDQEPALARRGASARPRPRAARCRRRASRASPRSSALRASAAANSPGTEISARFACGIEPERAAERARARQRLGAGHDLGFGRAARRPARIASAPGARRARAPR